MGGNLKVWVFNFRGKIFGGNTTVYISSGETNTVYLEPRFEPEKYQNLILIYTHSGL